MSVKCWPVSAKLTKTFPPPLLETLRVSTLQSRVKNLVQEIHPDLLVRAKEDDGRIEEAMVVPMGTTSQAELLLEHDVRAEHAEGEGQAGDLAEMLVYQVTGQEAPGQEGGLPDQGQEVGVRARQ